MFWFGLNIVHAAIVYKLLAVCLQTGHATTSLACPPKTIWILRGFLYPAPKTPSINAVLGSPLGSKSHNLTHDSWPCQSKAVELRAIWSRTKCYISSSKNFPLNGRFQINGQGHEKGFGTPINFDTPIRWIFCNVICNVICPIRPALEHEL